MTTTGPISAPRMVESPRDVETLQEPSVIRTASISHIHFKSLDGLRGIAILMVLFHHMFQGVEQKTGGLDFITKISGRMWMGVDLFFVLSGFLITGILYDSRDKRHYFRNFYMRRTLRIFPLYYACLFVGLLILPAITPAIMGVGTRPEQNPLWLFLYGTNFLIAKNQTWAAGSPLLNMSHFWSLAVEEHFYLVWPMVVYCVSKRRLAWAAAALFFGVAAVRSTWMLKTHDTFSIYILTPFRLDGMAIGAFIAILFRSERGRRIISKYAFFVFLGSILFLLGLRTVTGMDRESWTMPIFGYSLIALCFGSVIAVTVSRGTSSVWNQFLSTRLLVFFGKYSYGIYVFHLIALTLALRIHLAGRLFTVCHSPTISAYASVASAVNASILAAWLSWHLFEKHFLKLKRYFPS